MLARALGLCSWCLIAATSILSCSSGSDGTAPTDATGGSPGDASVDQLVDSAAEAAAEAGIDADAAPQSCPDLSWGNVPSTKCDVIEQQCGNGLTCYPNVIAGKPGTSCTFIGNGLKVRGQPCQDATECAQGLVCVMGFCAPFCCPDLQYEICGAGGLCDINLQVSSAYRVLVCSYATPCTLWQGGCPPGQACLPQGTDGSAACTPPASTAFVGEGQPCEASNDCGDAQACVGTTSPVCRYLCKLGETPFDAGVQGGEPGKGGCPDGQSCQALSDSPPWLGVCSPD